ncbi:MAG TPA: hypothetical protein VJI69_09475 [Bacteroidia bacterium]|nr:hypothetical protein [Bacteroidia bacterium]
MADKKYTPSVFSVFRWLIKFLENLFFELKKQIVWLWQTSRREHQEAINWYFTVNGCRNDYFNVGTGIVILLIALFIVFPFLSLWAVLKSTFKG